jgi:hypothetical protein
MGACRRGRRGGRWSGAGGRLGAATGAMGVATRGGEGHGRWGCLCFIPAVAARVRRKHSCEEEENRKEETEREKKRKSRKRKKKGKNMKKFPNLKNFREKIKRQFMKLVKIILYKKEIIPIIIK